VPLPASDDSSFGLLLFHVEPRFVRDAMAAGVDAVVVDWEQAGKALRQSGFDTQVNRHTVEDLSRVRAATPARVICRVNNGPTRNDEITLALDAGADEVLLPMVRSTGEVDDALTRVRERARLGILIETPEAVELASELARRPLARVYVGLNDLAICRGTRNIFVAVADGTVERVRGAVPPTTPFGFAGLTLPDRGQPIPCRLLIGELARLGCDFSFLRRSFLADIAGRDLAVEVPRLRAALAGARTRATAQVEADHQELLVAIREIDAAGR